jgi:soluble lytic murein transglycosylase
VDAGVPVDELQRGIVDYHAGEYGVAQAALDRYLQDNPADPGTAIHFYALSKRSLGELNEAVQRWDTLIANYPEHAYWDAAWEQKAYTQWAFLDQYQAAENTLVKFVEENPYHARAGEFLFDAAGIAERNNRLEQAADLWDRVAREYPTDERAARALFLLGVARYRLDDYPNSLDAFNRLAALAPPAGERAAAQYWIGKAYAALGDEGAARAAWEKAAEIDPTGYYSERAQDQLYHRPPFDPPLSYDLAYELERERGRAEDWMRATFTIAPDVNLADSSPLVAHPGLLRGIELWNLGLYDEARGEFEALRQELQNDPVGLYRLANLLVEIGAYRPAIMAGRGVLALAGMSDADTFNAPIYFNHLRFGAYYQDLILPLAKEYGLHPLLIFSVVRQESLFEGFVRSSAGASGLMQIMPPTGEDIAGRLGWPEDYSDEDLVRPLVNLTFGVDYLARQRQAFDNDLYAALAAYNGGPGNAIQWKKLAGDDPDVFLEVIRYAETREYIRRVYELFTIYRLLYDRTP